jgi:hypothetical protein
VRGQASERRQAEEVVGEGHSRQRQRGAERHRESRLRERAGDGDPGNDGDAAGARHRVRMQRAVVRRIEREPPARGREQQARDQQGGEERGKRRQREHGAHSSRLARGTTPRCAADLPRS